MPARVITAKDIVSTPDLSVDLNELGSLELQDCITIVNAFERGCHHSATEQALFAPIAHTAISNGIWAKTNGELIAARLIDSTLVDTTTGHKVTIHGNHSQNDISKALEYIKDNCVPCSDKIKLAVEHLPSDDLLKNFEEDIKSRIKMLTKLDSLLSDQSAFLNICALLEALDFMCVPDLQRLISILMASMFRINLDLNNAFGMVASLIMPIIMSVLSGVTHLLDQYQLLVVSPIDCVLDVLRESLVRVGNLTDSQEVAQQADNLSVVSGGLESLYQLTLDGRNYASSKLDFYSTALKKALGDWTGDSTVYLEQAQQKLLTIQMVQLISAIIKLKNQGGSLCQKGKKPTASELDKFFTNFLNPNSLLQFSVDPNGAIRVKEPGDVLYNIEEPGNGAKILSYEPDNLLQKPAEMEFKCSFHTDSNEVEKINSWIRDLNEAK